MFRELATYIVPLVAMLPSPYREAITLTELEGLTQQEAAEMVGISLSGMKSRVQRGRRLLRQALDECCEIALDARGAVMSAASVAYKMQPESEFEDRSDRTRRANSPARVRRGGQNIGYCTNYRFPDLIRVRAWSAWAHRRHSRCCAPCADRN